MELSDKIKILQAEAKNSLAVAKSVEMEDKEWAEKLRREAFATLDAIEILTDDEYAKKIALIYNVDFCE